MCNIKVKLAFKKIDKDSKIIPKLISWWTKSEYYHVEIILDGYWVSIFEDGVKINRLRELEGSWDYADLGDIEVSEVQRELFFKFLFLQNGKKYDFMGIFFSQLIPLRLQNPKRWFCSECVTSLLKLLYVREVFFKLPASMSPGDLAKIYLKK